MDLVDARMLQRTSGMADPIILPPYITRLDAHTLHYLLPVFTGLYAISIQAVAFIGIYFVNFARRNGTTA